MCNFAAVKPSMFKHLKYHLLALATVIAWAVSFIDTRVLLDVGVLPVELLVYRFIIAYVGNEQSDFELELTWLRDHPQPYDIGEEEFHLAFRTDDFEAAHALHEQMGCICFENPSMGIYFIQDPDGYWLEVLPTR